MPRRELEAPYNLTNEIRYESSRRKPYILQTALILQSRSTSDRRSHQRGYGNTAFRIRNIARLEKKFQEIRRFGDCRPPQGEPIQKGELHVSIQRRLGTNQQKTLRLRNRYGKRKLRRLFQSLLPPRLPRSMGGIETTIPLPVPRRGVRRRGERRGGTAAKSPGKVACQGRRWRPIC